MNPQDIAKKYGATFTPSTPNASTNSNINDMASKYGATVNPLDGFAVIDEQKRKSIFDRRPGDPTIQDFTQSIQDFTQSALTEFGNQFSSRVQAGAKDIQKNVDVFQNIMEKPGFYSAKDSVKDTGKVLGNSLLLAGDVAAAGFSHISSAFSLAMNKFKEKFPNFSREYGKLVVDTPADIISNSEKLQEFALKNPDAEHYVDSVINIAFAGMESARQNKQITQERTQAKLNDNLNSSVHDWDRLIENGDAPLEKIFTPKRTFQPEPLAHVISDMSTKMNEVTPGLGDKFKASVDLSNPTPSNILGQAKDFVSSGGKSGVSGAIKTGENIKGKPIEINPTVKNITSDIVPTLDRISNHEITKAFDLTQEDVKNIKLSTNNDVGDFVAKNNLIRNSVPETQKAIDDFYKTNYDAVRTEIGKVKTQYLANEIPQYKESLSAIKKQITDVPGLQKANAEVDALLKKKVVTLNDIQRTKELLDEHFSLYKATGDVKEGVAKTGLTNIRGKLRGFIEKEVKSKTGADIKELNNNVSTARSISDAIEIRSTRGLTRSMISSADIVTFLAGTAINPLGGFIAVIGKKLIQSPTFRLKLSKYLDGISDARKAKVLEDLKQGVVPPEIQASIRSNSESNLSANSESPATTPKTTLKNNDFISPNTTPKLSKSQGIIGKMANTIGEAQPAASILSGIEDAMPFLESKAGKMAKQKAFETYPFSDDAKKLLSKKTKVAELEESPLFDNSNKPLGLEGAAGATRPQTSFGKNRIEIMKGSPVETAAHELFHAAQHQYNIDLTGFNEAWGKALEAGNETLARIERDWLSADLYSDRTPEQLQNEKFAFLGNELGKGGLHAIPVEFRKYYRKILNPGKTASVNSQLTEGKRLQDEYKNSAIYKQQK